jgi:hypothetical protein
VEREVLRDGGAPAIGPELDLRHSASASRERVGRSW